MNKITLGTAQFGIDYGINNKRGKIPESEVSEILKEALKSGIDTLDTASLYGDSESVIGNFISKNPNSFKVISKLPDCDAGNVANEFNSSKKRLKTDKLYGYLIHDFKSFENNPGLWDQITRLKSEGSVSKIGFSLYFPREIDAITKRGIKSDILQIPYSIFDRRFEKYLPKLKQMGIEVHARSIFLQGLVFKKPDELNGQFLKIKGKIEKLNFLAEKLDISVASLCINFAILNEYLNKVVIGIDGLSNLRELVNANISIAKVKEIYKELLFLEIDDEKILLPFNWERKK